MPDYEYKLVSMESYMILAANRIDHASGFRVKKSIKEQLENDGWTQTFKFITHQGHYGGTNDYNNDNICVDTKQYQVWRRER